MTAEQERTRLSVVVPAYREAPRIADAVNGLRAALVEVERAGGLEIVVVDDGSDDETADNARRAGADHVVVLPENRGKGAAVRAGVLLASGRTIAYTDADLSYSPDQLIGLLEQVEGGADVVIGSRRHVDTSTLVRARRLREVSGRAFSILTALVLRGTERDTQCGLKAFRAEVARVLFGRGRVDGFAFDVEVLHLAERYGLTVTEVPVTLTSASSSTVRVVGEAARMLRDLFRIRRLAMSGVYELADDEARLLRPPPAHR